MKEAPCECKAGAPDWMVTFADLMSLLLTFFVLLLSFSNMEITKFREMSGSMRDAFGLKSRLDLSDVPMGQNLLPHEDPKEGDGGDGPTAEEIVRQLEEMLEEAGMQRSGEAKVDKHGVILQLQGDLLFESGRAELKGKAHPLLDALALYISRVNRSVDVVGHTDNIPIATAVYPSNWELSAARAGQAVRYLAERGVKPESMRAIGQAHTVAVESNDSAIGRSANRRVEFVFSAKETAPDEKALEELTAEPQPPEQQPETGGNGSE